MVPHQAVRARLATAVLVAVTLSAGCATAKRKKQEAIYGPTESVIEVIAVLRRHISDDTYRFPPPTDFTGRNVYRASLLRLENMEHLHAGHLRAGHLDASMAFAKGRALERLRGYDLAAQHYRSAATREGVLQEPARQAAVFCDDLHRATALGPDLVDPLSAEAALPLDAEAAVAGWDERERRLTDLLDRAGKKVPVHYGFIVKEEIERTDVARARYFAALRHALPGGQVRAIAEAQRVIMRHAASKEYNRHVIDLADLYADLAEEYVEANPPHSLRFDPPSFHELVESASRLYQTVASRDGSPEKLEAARRFEAFLAFTLRVDSGRFSQ
ncbi:MAG: hypothetical protein O7G30_03200 [Proteobacteria bacterium]|nr:hypothetical protein [Pseudomonadota bacterium]